MLVGLPRASSKAARAQTLRSGRTRREVQTMVASVPARVRLFLDALERHGCAPCQMREGQWIAKCPAHEDRNPSLSVGVGRAGQPLAHCFRGCSYASIRSSVEFTDSDAAPPASRCSAPTQPTSRTTDI